MYNHYARKKLLASVSKKNNGCWIWSTGVGKTYPAFWWNGASEDAHRASYKMNKGEIPEGYVVMHSCDNMRCVNPAHLTAGTYGANLKDAYNKGRADKKGEKHHKASLTDADIKSIYQLKNKMKQKEIALLFNTKPNNISRILSGKRWGHLAPSYL